MSSNIDGNKTKPDRITINTGRSGTEYPESTRSSKHPYTPNTPGLPPSPPFPQAFQYCTVACHTCPSGTSVAPENIGKECSTYYHEIGEVKRSIQPDGKHQETHKGTTISPLPIVHQKTHAQPVENPINNNCGYCVPNYHASTWGDTSTWRLLKSPTIYPSQYYSTTRTHRTLRDIFKHRMNIFKRKFNIH